MEDIIDTPAVLLMFVLAAFVILLLAYDRKKNEHAQLTQAYRSLQQEKDVVVSFIREIGDAMTSAHDIQKLLKLTISCAKRTLNASSGAIFLLNEEHTHLQAKMVDGLFPPIFEPIPAEALSKLATKARYIHEFIMNLKIGVGQGLVGTTAQTRLSILIRDARRDTRIIQPPIDFLKVKTFMAVPLIFKDEVMGVMTAANKENESGFTDLDLSLFEALSDQAALSLHNARLYRELAEKERLDKELQTATQVQALLMPTHFPKIKGIDFAATTRPAREIGGDYYDVFPIGPDKFGIAIADVSGKGIPAALIMSMARSILKTISVGQTSPRTVLGELNRLLFHDIQQEMFISFAYLVFDETSRQLKLTRAGHEPLLFYDSQEKIVKSLRPQGMVLGMDSGSLFSATLEEVLLTFKDGDALVLYTDGITEAQDPEGREFGLEALSELIKTSTHLSSHDMSLLVLNRIVRFTGNFPQTDDMTLVIIKAQEFVQQLA